jgi:hypothetical protein
MAAFKQGGHRVENSAYVGCPPLGFGLNDSLWLRWQLKNRGLLTLTQACQEHDLTVWKFQCIVMSDDPVFVDLPKDRYLMLDCTVVPRPQSNWQALNLVSKGKLRSRQNADCDARVFRCRESSCARPKVAHGKLVGNFSGPRFDGVKAVIAHLGTLPLESPSASSILPSFSS